MNNDESLSLPRVYKPVFMAICTFRQNDCPQLYNYHSFEHNIYGNERFWLSSIMVKISSYDDQYSAAGSLLYIYVDQNENMCQWQFFKISLDGTNAGNINK